MLKIFHPMMYYVEVSHVKPFLRQAIVLDLKTKQKELYFLIL